MRQELKEELRDDVRRALVRDWEDNRGLYGWTGFGLDGDLDSIVDAVGRFIEEKMELSPRG